MESFRQNYDDFDQTTCYNVSQILSVPTGHDELDLEFAVLEDFLDDITTIKNQAWDQSFCDGIHAMISNSDIACVEEQTEKHNPTTDKSYFALIALAIQSSPQGKMLLTEIYEWVKCNSMNLRKGDQSWKNSVRHTLSINECFIKSGLSETGKGHYWAIHPACVQSFQKNDFRRLNARCLVKKYEQMRQDLGSHSEVNPDNINVDNFVCHGYVPMTLTCDSGIALAKIFGSEVIFNQQEVNTGKQTSDVDHQVYSNENIQIMQLDPGCEFEYSDYNEWMTLVY